METILSINHLTKTFRNKNGRVFEVLKDIALDVRRGEFLVFLGPSGSGKSTLLRVMSGLEKKFTGALTLSPDIDPHEVSFVFQQFALLPWLTVFENIELGILAQPLTPEEREAKIARELKRFGLEAFKDVYPRELSGGMRQRVGIARAFVSDPKIIFMDEPFSELDSFTAAELRKAFLKLWEEQHTTVVMVTHLIDEAIELADRIVVLSPRPAEIDKIVENTLKRPREKRSPDFFKLEDELYELVKP